MFLAGSVISFITSSLSNSFTCTRNRPVWHVIQHTVRNYIIIQTSYAREASKVYWILVSNNMSFFWTRAWIQFLSRAMVSLSSLEMGYRQIYTQWHVTEYHMQVTLINYAGSSVEPLNRDKLINRTFCCPKHPVLNITRKIRTHR